MAKMIPKTFKLEEKQEVALKKKVSEKLDAGIEMSEAEIVRQLIDRFIHKI